MSGLVLPPPENKQDVKYAPYKDETEMRKGQKHYRDNFGLNIKVIGVVRNLLLVNHLSNKAYVLK